MGQAQPGDGLTAALGHGGPGTMEPVHEDVVIVLVAVPLEGVYRRKANFFFLRIDGQPGQSLCGIGVLHAAR